MPKGKKNCPSCQKEHGARKRQCECGHVFGRKQESNDDPVKQTKHPLGKKYVPTPGLWVFDKEKGMPPIPTPEDMPDGPMNNQEVYDYCAFNGAGDCIMEYIPARKIADPKLRKLWKKAHDAMADAWRYLTDEHETN